MEDLTIIGRLQSGMQKGRKFLANPIYKDIFTKELGTLPYLGTLNLVITEEDLELIEPIISDGTVYSDLENNGVKLGDIIIYPVILSHNYNVQKSVVVRPLKTAHRSTTLEIVSGIYFRGEWGLVDGDEVQIIIQDK